MSGRSDPKTTAMIPSGGEMLALTIANQITNPAIAWVDPINSEQLRSTNDSSLLIGLCGMKVGPSSECSLNQAERSRDDMKEISA